MSWHWPDKGGGAEEEGRRAFHREEMAQTEVQTFCVMRSKLENSTHMILQR